jgi:hypothetical protein
MVSGSHPKKTTRLNFKGPTRYPILIPKSSIIGKATMGARAAPTPQEVTGQKEFGKCASETPNLSLISIAALVIDVALKPTMKVL